MQPEPQQELHLHQHFKELVSVEFGGETLWFKRFEIPVWNKMPREAKRHYLNKARKNLVKGTHVRVNTDDGKTAIIPKELARRLGAL